MDCKCCHSNQATEYFLFGKEYLCINCHEYIKDILIKVFAEVYGKKLEDDVK